MAGIKRANRSGTRLGGTNTEAAIRLASCYLAKMDGYSWANLAESTGYAQATSCRSATRVFAMKHELPWPPESWPQP